MEVIRQDNIQVIRIINSVFSSCTYILSDPNSDYVWLIDCGDVEPILAWLEKNRKNSVQGVLLTHIHFDHIYGLNVLLEHFPDCLIYTNAIGEEALQDSKRNMSRYHHHDFQLDKLENVMLLKGGELLIADDTSAISVETPGHSNTCITWMIDNMLFTGDAYIPGLKVVTKLPTGNKVQAEDSLNKILKLAEGKSVYAGHAVL